MRWSKNGIGVEIVVGGIGVGVGVVGEDERDLKAGDGRGGGGACIERGMEGEVADRRGGKGVGDLYIRCLMSEIRLFEFACAVGVMVMMMLIGVAAGGFVWVEWSSWDGIGWDRTGYASSR